jgi:hypothetical protein
MGMFKRGVAVVVAVMAAAALLIGPNATPALALNNSYPAAPIMDAYMNYFAGQGKSGAEQLCLSALYASYYWAEYVWGPSVGVPSGMGAALYGVYFNGQWSGHCPGTGADANNRPHYGQTCASTPGWPCPEGPGPYISVGSVNTTNAFAGAEGWTPSATVYYVWTHESGHQWAYRSGYAGATDECYADSFAVGVGGARDFFGYCV